MRREPTEVGGGRYEVVEPIARGSMGAVLRGRRRSDGVEVAIKRLLDPEHQARFEIEARLLARLDHPRVVRVLDHFSEGDESYLVMELVRGDDLRRLARRSDAQRLPPGEAVAHVSQACEALDYVHSEHVVHRDVKPQNLILGEDGVVLVDFGVAREAAGAGTMTIGAGTPGYMAPEVAAGGSASARSDVYGLAATLWALLTGAPPRYGLREPITAHVPDLDPDVEAALLAGLALDPAARVPSAMAFARALGASLVGGAGASLARTVQRPRRPAAALAAVARAAAGVLEATAVSLAFADEHSGEIVYEAAWGAGADQIVGVRLPAGSGLAGAALATGQVVVAPDCRADPRFAHAVAESTGYVPHTMIAVPLAGHGMPPGVLSALDRADGRPFTIADAPRATHAAELVLLALAGAEDATRAP